MFVNLDDLLGATLGKVLSMMIDKITYIDVTYLI